MSKMTNGNRAAVRIGVLLLAAFVAATLHSRPSRAGADLQKPAATVGMLFAMTNQRLANEVVAYTRSATGPLTFLNSYPTQGMGTGADLNSQGALLYLPAMNLLYVANANSSDITGFAVSPTGLTFISRTPSGGRLAISLTALGSTLYVLNALTPNIQGFTINADGTLSQILGATGSLSGVGGTIKPSQVSFTPSGTQIIVTEKATSKIDVFPFIAATGTLGAPTFGPSQGADPLGFAFDASGFLDVTEGLQEATSSYQVNSDNTLSVISPSVGDRGVEPAHIVESTTLSPQLAYVSNAITDYIASYTVLPGGGLQLSNSSAARLPASSKALDMVIDPSGSFLYILTQKNGTITGYTIKPTGGLALLTTLSDLPHSGTWGLAGY